MNHINHRIEVPHPSTEAPDATDNRQASLPPFPFKHRDRDQNAAEHFSATHYDPMRVTADDGTPVVQVRLRGFGDHLVTLDAKDFDWLEDRGLTGGWYVNRDRNGRLYPTKTCGYRAYTLASLILGNSPHYRAHYLTSDRLNLRRNNLTTRPYVRTRKLPSHWDGRPMSYLNE